MKLTGTQMLGRVADACKQVADAVTDPANETPHTLRCVTTETTYFTFTKTVVVEGGLVLEVTVSRPIPKTPI